jgi:hypothetical protein
MTDTDTKPKPYVGPCLSCGGAQIQYNPTTHINDNCNDCGGTGYHREPPTDAERERMAEESRRFFAPRPTT